MATDALLLAALLSALRSALHLGQLHAYEQALLAVIAFGPFVVLAVVVYVIRRREAREDPDRPS
jgi:hypothetical protein